MKRPVFAISSPVDLNQDITADEIVRGFIPNPDGTFTVYQSEISAMMIAKESGQAKPVIVLSCDLSEEALLKLAVEKTDPNEATRYNVPGAQLTMVEALLSHIPGKLPPEKLFINLGDAAPQISVDGFKREYKESKSSPREAAAGGARRVNATQQRTQLTDKMLRNDATVAALLLTSPLWVPGIVCAAYAYYYGMGVYSTLSVLSIALNSLALLGMRFSWPTLYHFRKKEKQLAAFNRLKEKFDADSELIEKFGKVFKEAPEKMPIDAGLRVRQAEFSQYQVLRIAIDARAQATSKPDTAEAILNDAAAVAQGLKEIERLRK